MHAPPRILVTRRLPDATQAALRENTFLLPHLGSATVETREAMGRKALENLEALLAGRPPPDAVVPPGAGDPRPH